MSVLINAISLLLAIVLGWFIVGLAIGQIWFGFRWALLVPRCYRPEILNRPHTDWKLLKFIPRALTAWIADEAPVKLLGTEREEDHLDIPEPGKWVVAFPLYVAITETNGKHTRFGWRFDYVERPGYYTFPAVTFRKPLI